MRASRDTEVIRRMYRTHVRAVYAFFAYSVTSETAEDLTQATFERVVKRWESFDPERGSEKTWILAIAKNTLVDHFRREQHRTTVSTDEHPGLLDRLSTTTSPIDRRIRTDGLLEWLEQLDERERLLIALRYGADMSTSEVAESTGLSLANVQQILSRCLRRLRASSGVNDSGERTG